MIVLPAPCAKHPDSLRDSRRRCLTCAKINAKNSRDANKERLIERRAKNRELLRLRNRVSQAKNKDKIAIYRANNKEKAAAWRANNKVQIKERTLAWSNANRHIRNAGIARHYAKRRQATPLWANEFFMSEIYHLAKLREAALGGKWEVDHIVPIQSDLVCGLHVEGNMRVISKLANIQKGNRYWPDMPT